MDLTNLRFIYVFMGSETKSESNPTNRIRSIFDWVMGIIYLAVGVVLTFAPWLGIHIYFPPPDVARIFGTACMIYGGFRIYRGIKTRHAE